MATAKKLCLIIRPIGEDDSDVRRRTDLLLRYLVGPALDECGYLPVRADKISEPGFITPQIIQHVFNVPLVVADLTGMSAAVFYALALRHAVRKPLVQLVRRGEKLPFDTGVLNVIPVDHTDLESVDEAKSEIIRQIKAKEDKRPDEIDSPVSMAVQLQHLTQGGSSKPEERSLVEILSFVNDLRDDLTARLSAIERRLAALPSGFTPDLADRHLLRVSRQGAQDEINALFTEIGRIEDLISPSRQIAGSEPLHEQAQLREAQARLTALRERGEILKAMPQF